VNNRLPGRSDIPGKGLTRFGATGNGHSNEPVSFPYRNRTVCAEAPSAGTLVEW
jgi:hypothetical protein